jgi:ribosomal protein S18 acetylase RimI-like enzyme
MEYKKVCLEDKKAIENLSALAAKIVKQHFDPIIGTKQNDYMISKFQSVSAITEQIAMGYRYYFVEHNQENVGFMAFYPKSGKMYLSKLYVDSIYRGKGISSKMFQFIKQETMKEKLSAIILNVNRNNTEVIRIYEHLGFCKVREEENDIGNGYFMEDFVLEYTCNYE